MLKIKTIPLLPSDWSLDVITTSSGKELNKLARKRYGFDLYDFENADIFPSGFVTLAESEKKSKLKGESRIVMYLNAPKINLATVAHEVHHVLCFMERFMGVDMTWDSQEWNAMMTSYLFEQISDKKSYKKIK